MIERASLRNKCKVLCFWASKLLKEREFGGKMQNIGLEMRKCVAGGQKMGLQAPNTTIARESGRTFDEGGRKVSTKEAAHSEKAGATRSQLDLSRRKVGAHSARGAGGFPQKRWRTRRKWGRLVLNSTFRAEKWAHIRRGAGGFPQKRWRTRRKRGRTQREGAKKRRTPRGSATRGLVLRRSQAFCVRTWRFLI